MMKKSYSIRTRRTGLFLSVLALAMSTALPAQQQAANTEAPTLMGALRQGETAVRLRLRFEDVGQDGFPKDAHAMTLRTTLGYKTLPYKGFRLEIEAENIAEIGNDLFNNRGAGSDFNGVTDRPVVADPASTELNQVFLAYETGDSEITLGRREIRLGDSRYVGNVGWRQNHQSFDAFTFTNTSLDKLTFDYGYIDKVHRIFGDSLPMSSHFGNATIKVGGAGKLTLYGYLVDYDRRQNAGRSSTTWGAELKGKRQGARIKLLWELEAADAGDNPRQIDAGYLHTVVGAEFERFTVKLGYEVLEGSAQDGQFNTPLATLHAWNGWADKFLSTPTAGLTDLYLSLGCKIGKIGWTAIYHEFEAETGNTTYGEELDIQLTYKAPWGQGFGFKGAFYDADSFATDTDKLMFWTTFGF